MESKELAIIGAGIAGISASIYAKRAGCTFYLFEKNLLGGQLLYIDRIDNYPGLPSISGWEILNNLKKNLESLEIKPIFKEVKRVEVKDSLVNLWFDDERITVKALIISTGASFRKLGIEGEDKFLGKGVSYCAICDGTFFKGKKVVVVGGGNTAVAEALYLSQLCERVYLVHRRDKLRAIDILQRKLFEKKNIDILWNTEVVEIKGERFVEKVVVKKDNVFSDLKVDGVFIAIGMVPNTEIFKKVVKLDDGGFVVTDENMVTSVPFIFSCGDCRRRPLRQLITASSEGAIAALSAYRYLRGEYISI